MTLGPDWPTFHDLLHAYKSCRLGKPASSSQTTFETRLARNITDLEEKIRLGSYRPAPAKCFIVTHPKPREIFAAEFQDRVVHHLVVSQLEPIWDPKFIDSSFACRVGRGTHGAIRSAQKQVRRLSRGGIDPVWCLQLDIEKFFVTIDRQILCGLLLKHVTHAKLRELIQAIYGHDARVGVKRGGNPASFKLIPEGKSWFDQGPGQGIPIGNLTSQFGANVYLTALDHFIQRELKPGAYLRYMDDLLWLDRNPDRLQTMGEPIRSWLESHRKQRLNPDKTKLTQLRKGIRYLGYELKQVDLPAKPLQVFSEPQKRWKLIQALRRLENAPAPYPRPLHPLSLPLPDPEVMREITAVNSRIGSLLHANTFRFRKKALEKFRTRSKDPKDLPPEIADSWSPYAVKRGYRALRLR